MFCVMRVVLGMKVWIKYLLFTGIFLSWHVARLHATCDANWEEHNSQCYTVVEQISPYMGVQDAREQCYALGADLAVVQDNDTENAIYTSVLSQALNIERAFIGVTDITTEGNYTWLNDTDITYSHFQNTTLLSWPGENLRDCVAVYSPGAAWISPDPYWIDVPCCFNPLNINAVVCEKPSTSNATVYNDDIFNAYCQTDCPSGWYKWEGICYGFMTNSTITRVYDARQMCMDDSADIGNLLDEDIVQHVAMVANNTQNPPGDFYISLNDIALEGSFRHDNSTTLTMNYWTGGTAPASDNTTNCVSVTSVGGEWQNDTEWTNVECCSDQGVSWVLCEKPDNSSAPAVTSDNDIFAHACDARECDSNPCFYGTCEEEILGYSCVCDAGYTGSNCETNIDDCDPDPCNSHGDCTDGVDSFTCDCHPGYGNAQCDIIDDYCIACTPCTGVIGGINTASCDDGTPAVSECGLGSPFVCNCNPGFEGDRCETEIDECASNPCVNNGTCSEEINGYSCICPDSFTGVHCETEVLCDADVAVENASISDQSSDVPPTLDSYITFTCDDGHKFPDMERTKSIYCEATGWNRTLPACEPHCDILPVIRASTYPADATTAVGYTLNYTCNEGNQFPDNSTTFNITCQDNGEWTQTNLSHCEVVTCPELPDYEHQTMNHNNNTYNSTVIFWCDLGYSIYDGTTARSIKCHADGEWSADLPTCDPIQCDAIDLPASSSRNTTATEYNTYARYNCNSGKRMLDGATYRVIKCDATGNWSDTVTACTTERCFPLPYVANATPDATDANHGNVRQLTCIAGHRFNDQSQMNEMTCGSNNRWTPLLRSCEPLLCDPLTLGAQSTQDTTNELFGTVVTVSCADGHYFSGETYNDIAVECVEGPLWNNTVVDCEPVTCTDPPEILNGTRELPAQTDGEYVYADTAQYDCDNGTKFIDGYTTRTLTCADAGVAQGTWDLGDDVTCLSERCDPVPSVTDTVTNTSDTQWDVVVQYTCAPGYEWISGPQEHLITCNYGEWNGTDLVPPCTIKNCDPVPERVHATADTSNTTYDTHVLYTCHVGYMYHGDEDDAADDTQQKSMRCSETPEWVPVEDANEPMPNCTIMYCSELDDIENATKSTNETFYDTELAYTCWDGYQFTESTRENRITEKTVTCEANQTTSAWSQDPETFGPCEVIFCPPVPTWNAEFSSTENEFEAVVDYWCTEGNLFEDGDTNKTARCAENKRWRPSIADCVPASSIAESLQGKTYESKDGPSIGMVAITLVSLLIAAIILLDLNKIYTDLKVMKGNVESMIEYRRNKNKVTDSSTNVRDAGESNA